MRKILLLLILSIFVVGCTINDEQLNNNPTPTPSAEVTSLQLNEMALALVERLESADITIENIHSHDEESFFDRLFGDARTAWVELTADGEPMNIYAFASAAEVETALAGRRRNGYLFTHTRDDGTLVQMPLDGNPYFWQVDNVLIHLLRPSQELSQKLETAIGAAVTWQSSAQPQQEAVRVRVYNDSDLDFDSVELGWADVQQIGAVPARGYSDYFTFEYAYHYGYIIVTVGNRTYSFQPIDYVGESYLSAGDYTFALTPVGGEYDHLATQMMRDGGAAINPNLTETRWYWAAAMTQDGTFSFPTGETPYIELTREPLADRLTLTAFDGCETFSIPYQLGVEYGIVTFEMPAMTCGDARIVAMLDTLTQIEAGDQFARLYTSDWQGFIMTRAQPTGSHTDPAALAPVILKVQYFDAINATASQFADSAAWMFDYFDQQFTAHIFADASAAQAASQQVESDTSAWLFENALITYRPNPDSRIGSIEETLTEAFGNPVMATTSESVTVQLDQPFELGVGQSAELLTTTLTLTAVTNDSRCPVDVECFWAGEATVEFMTGTNESFTLVIGGSDGTDERATYQIGDYLLQIEALAPAQHSEQPIAPADYRATLRVTAVD